MEEIYMKGFVGRREWCSEKVHLKSYFENYNDELSILLKKRISDIDLLQHFVPQSNQLSEKELLNLGEATNRVQLTTLSDEDLKKGKGTAGSSNLAEPFATGDKRPKNRIKRDKAVLRRRDVTLNAAEKRGTKNLIANTHFVVSFRIHEAFVHNVGDHQPPGRCMQQVNVLGHQVLSDLRDMIICETDYQDIRGDISDRPDTTTKTRAHEVYQSSMFYFDNTFYVDWRDSEKVDYSRPIKEWARGRGLKLGESLPMERTTVESLEVRFGYPYLYMHQGGCEHLVVISDARFLNAKDSLYSSDYPLMMKVSHQNLMYCMTCSNFPARWIIRDCDRLAHDPSYQCKSCFKSMNYVNGKKIGRFKAYLYWQRATIL